MKEFVGFPKIPRLSRDIIVTEKIDGTNAQIYISEDGTEFLTGSRNRWITPDKDNHGFSKWAHEHKDELMKLGPGHHFGEWYGQGINCGYGLKEKRFALFNVKRWEDNSVRPACCEIVPILYKGIFDLVVIEYCLKKLAFDGSSAAPGFMDPEGVMVFHIAANHYFKKTIKHDDERKSQVNA